MSVFALIFQAQLDTKSEAALLHSKARAWSCSEEAEPLHMQGQVVGCVPADGYSTKAFSVMRTNVAQLLPEGEQKGAVLQSTVFPKPLYIGS